jgi:hypothetical protein
MHLSVKVQEPRFELGQSGLAALRSLQKSTYVVEKS